MKSLLILGIESSCDETATAIYDSEKGLIGHQVFSQIDLHKKYGGVVPELASRDHIRKLLPMIDHLLKETEKSLEDIDAIAYTAGPGLSGALLVGSVMANGLAFSLGIPSVPIHHMEAHLLAPLLEQESAKMPFIALLVSGGHTLLVLVKSKGEYELVGQTLDDAAGEAFDKAAKLLGLNYPGGPEIAKLAEMGEPDIFDFPRPLSKDKGSLDFSFSGLKTSLMYRVKQLREDGALDDQCRADLSYAYQEAIVDSLVGKTELAKHSVPVKQAFDAFDSKSRGKVGCDEFVDGLEKLGILSPLSTWPGTAKDVVLIFARLDEDSDEDTDDRRGRQRRNRSSDDEDSSDNSRRNERQNKNSRRRRPRRKSNYSSDSD